MEVKIRPKLAGRVLASTGTIALVTATALAWSGGASAAINKSASGSPIEFATVAAETGQTGPYGAADAQGVKAEIALVNKAGGVLGHPLKYVGIDDGGDATKAAAATTQLLTSSTPPLMVWAGATTLDGAGVDQVLKPTKVIGFYASNVLVPGTNASTYDLFPLAPQTIAGTVAQVRSMAGQNPKVGVLATTDASGQAAIAADQSGLKQAGLKVVGVQQVSPTAVDMTSQLGALKSEGVQAIVAAFVEPNLYVTLMNNIKELGWSSVKVAGDTAGVGASIMEGVPKTNPPNYSGLGTAPIVRASSSTAIPAKTKTFINAFEAAGGSSAFLLEAFQGADSVNMMVWAMKQANSTDPSKINAVLQDTHKKTMPADLLYQVPPPAFSSSVHTLSGANFSHYWSVVYPGTPVDGIYVGKVLPVAG